MQIQRRDLPVSTRYGGAPFCLQFAVDTTAPRTSKTSPSDDSRGGVGVCVLSSGPFECGAKGSGALPTEELPCPLCAEASTTRITSSSGSTHGSSSPIATASCGIPTGSAFIHCRAVASYPSFPAVSNPTSVSSPVCDSRAHEDDECGGGDGMMAPPPHQRRRLLSMESISESSMDGARGGSVTPMNGYIAGLEQLQSETPDFATGYESAGSLISLDDLLLLQPAHSCDDGPVVAGVLPSLQLPAPWSLTQHQAASDGDAPHFWPQRPSAAAEASDCMPLSMSSTAIAHAQPMSTDVLDDTCCVPKWWPLAATAAGCTVYDFGVATPENEYSRCHSC